MTRDQVIGIMAAAIFAARMAANPRRARLDTLRRTTNEPARKWHGGGYVARGFQLSDIIGQLKAVNILWLVGPPGFEPGTSCTPSKRPLTGIST